VVGDRRVGVKLERCGVGGEELGRGTWFGVGSGRPDVEKITPKHTTSHIGIDRIKQPLTLLDGCQRAGVYFEHTFERPVKEARS